MKPSKIMCINRFQIFDIFKQGFKITICHETGYVKCMTSIKYLKNALGQKKTNMKLRLFLLFARILISLQLMLQRINLTFKFRKLLACNVNLVIIIPLIHIFLIIYVIYLLTLNLFRIFNIF